MGSNRRRRGHDRRVARKRLAADNPVDENCVILLLLLEKMVLTQTGKGGHEGLQMDGCFDGMGLADWMRFQTR
jgi:hypothetical protein